MYVLKSCVGNIVGLETEAEPAAGRPRAAQEGEIWETQRATETQERGGGEEEEERGGGEEEEERGGGEEEEERGGGEEEEERGGGEEEEERGGGEDEEERGGCQVKFWFHTQTCIFISTEFPHKWTTWKY